ncbi:hypothetical protein L596_019422 [Steinernema carpocapsae]|uniref:Uncharacterized protein n=1 Tax=Steinernema carpocapsae TaxID=34508 RepID=A0A4U5MQH5_STECR|nr:hypothetical protein L596_019422 [Steinernema carpocapsae]
MFKSKSSLIKILCNRADFNAELPSLPGARETVEAAVIGRFNFSIQAYGAIHSSSDRVQLIYASVHLIVIPN